LFGEDNQLFYLNFMKKAFSKILLIFILAIILGVLYFVLGGAAKKNQGPTSQVPDVQVVMRGA